MFLRDLGLSPNYTVFQPRGLDPSLSELYGQMFVIIQSKQVWYKHTMRLPVLHVSAFCGHHQVQSPFLLSAVPPYTGQCLHIGKALYSYMLFV
jgi:hypothetical protein